MSCNKRVESEHEVGVKGSSCEGRNYSGGSENLDICPVIVMLPNPLFDHRAAQADETTVGGSGMLSRWQGSI